MRPGRPSGGRRRASHVSKVPLELRPRHRAGDLPRRRAAARRASWSSPTSGAPSRCRSGPRCRCSPRRTAATTCTPASGCCRGPRCSGCGWSRPGRSSRPAASRAGGWGRWTADDEDRVLRAGRGAGARRARRPTRPRTSSARCSTRSPTRCRAPRRRPSGAAAVARPQFEQRLRERLRRYAEPRPRPAPAGADLAAGGGRRGGAGRRVRCGWCSRSTTSRTRCTSATPRCCGPSRGPGAAHGFGDRARTHAAHRAAGGGRGLAGARPAARAAGARPDHPRRRRAREPARATAWPRSPPAGSTCSGRAAWAAT